MRVLMLPLMSHQDVATYMVSVWLEPARGCTEAGDIDLQGLQHLFLRLSAADLSLPSFILSEARVLSSLSPLSTRTRYQEGI